MKKITAKYFQIGLVGILIVGIFALIGFLTPGPIFQGNLQLKLDVPSDLSKPGNDTTLIPQPYPLLVSKSASSLAQNISAGGVEIPLATFKLTAYYPTKDIILKAIKVDLSSKSNATGAQNATGVMECTVGGACDLTGSVKVRIDENSDNASDKTILTMSAASNPVSNLWDISKLLMYDLSTFYTLQGGKSVQLMIVGNVSSNAGTGETIQVGIQDVLYSIAGEPEGKVYHTHFLKQGNVLAVN